MHPLARSRDETSRATPKRTDQTMRARNTVTAVVMCVIGASAGASDFFGRADVVDSYPGELGSIFGARVATTFEPGGGTAKLAWGNMSSVRVVTFGIEFTTDMRLRDAHLYKITQSLQDSGFATTPGPLNAVDIVLLENLHPRFEDMKIGDIGEGQAVSSQLTSGSKRSAFHAVLEEFNYVPIGTPAESGGGHFPSGMSTHSADLTDEFLDSLDQVSGTFDSIADPLGKHGHFGETSFWNPGGFDVGGVGSGGHDKLMVVPLPLPGILAGIGLAGVMLMRRSMRRTGV